MSAADHLEVRRQHGLFNHHGIDLGDGTVAHYLEGKEILKSSIQEFSRNQTVKIIHHPIECSRQITLDRANSRIGEQNYNLLFNNCEHFAQWCKTGRHRSNQLENLLTKSSIGAIALGQVFPAAFLTGLNVLIKQGVLNEPYINEAKIKLKEIDKIRNNLIHQLESTLEKANLKLNQEKSQMIHSNNKRGASKLILIGQSIADKISSIEDLETKITGLIQQRNW